MSVPRGTPGHPIGPRPWWELPGGNGGAAAASVREGGRASMDRFVVRRARDPQSPRRAAPGPRVCRQVTLESLKAGHRREGAGTRPGLPGPRRVVSPRHRVRHGRGGAGRRRRRGVRTPALHRNLCSAEVGSSQGSGYTGAEGSAALEGVPWAVTRRGAGSGWAHDSRIAR